MIGTQNRYLNQCKYEPCEKTQLLPCYKVLHAHHLPSILINHGSVERPLTVSGMPSKSSIPHFAKNVKQPHHCRSVPVGGAAVLLPCSRATARLYYYNSIACYVRSVCPGSTASPNRTCPKLPANFQYSELSSETV